MTVSAVAAVVVFAAAYVLIASEKVNRTAVALGGAAAMVVIGVVRGGDVFFSEETGIDWNVIFLLLGMMIIVGVLRQTGIFEFVAIWAAQKARARPFRMMALLIVITAVASALLDNVTTVLLVAPVTLLLCERLALAPVPFLLAEAPRLIFPFARQVVADAVSNAGFPPLLLDPIDFGAAYMSQMQQMQQQGDAAPAPEPAGEEPGNA